MKLAHTCELQKADILKKNIIIESLENNIETINKTFKDKTYIINNLEKELKLNNEKFQNLQNNHEILNNRLKNCEKILNETTQQKTLLERRLKHLLRNRV